MKIGSITEDRSLEKRVAITPEVAKKYISNGFQVFITKSYAEHLGFINKEYETLGVSTLENANDVIKSSDIIVQLGLPSEDKTALLKEKQILIGVLNPYINQEKLDTLVKRKINNFSLEMLPRITRAQSMDILSS